MFFERVTTKEQINSYINECIAKKIKIACYNLSKVGEQLVNTARSTDSYKDQTGNLRSSIGYIVLVDGKIYQMSNFETVSNGSKGSISGKLFANDIIKRFNIGVVLVVVAGMNYAAYVSAKGYDVIDSAELLADKLVPKMLKQIGFI